MVWKLYTKMIAMRTTLLVISCLLMITSVSGCPSMCICNVNRDRIYCEGKNLPRIPAGIPSNAKTLNLQNNNFKSTTLVRSDFSKFVDLQELFLADCHIEHITVNAFVDLRKLEWLDLSKNRLKVILQHTFYGLSSLTRLFFSGNRGISFHKDSFVGLEKLEGLRIDGCELKEISMEVFTPVNNTLKNLRLDNNNIRDMDPNFVSIFSRLEHLRLGGNPLHCNCKTSWLHSLVSRHSALFSGATPPWCGFPKRYEHKYLTNLSENDFQCEVPSFSDVNLAIRDRGGVLNCAARGDPLPRILWTKPSGEKLIFDPPSVSGATENRAVLIISGDDVMGAFTCIASNDAGNVTLALNVTWPTSPITSTTVPSLKLQTTNEIKTTPKADRLETRPDVKNSQTHSTTVISKDRGNNSPPTNNRVKTTPVKTENSSSGDLHRRTFGIIELVAAVLGTFIGTVILCVLIVFLFFRGKRKIIEKRRQKLCNQRHSNSLHGNHVRIKHVKNNQKCAQYLTKPSMPEIMGFIETCESKENQENQQNLNC